MSINHQDLRESIPRAEELIELIQNIEIETKNDASASTSVGVTREALRDKVVVYTYMNSKILGEIQQKFDDLLKDKFGDHVPDIWKNTRKPFFSFFSPKTVSLETRMIKAAKSTHPTDLALLKAAILSIEEVRKKGVKVKDLYQQQPPSPKL